MGMLGKLTQGLIDVALLHVDVAKDAVEMFDFDKESNGAKKLRKLKDKGEEIYEDLGK